MPDDPIVAPLAGTSRVTYVAIETSIVPTGQSLVTYVAIETSITPTAAAAQIQPQVCCIT